MASLVQAPSSLAGARRQLSTPRPNGSLMPHDPTCREAGHSRTYAQRARRCACHRSPNKSRPNQAHVNEAGSSSSGEDVKLVFTELLDSRNSTQSLLEAGHRIVWYGAHRLPAEVTHAMH